MAEGELIKEANVGTIPYMAMWVLFLCALLSTLCHPAMALLDHDRQVVAYDCGKPTDMQAYDIGERNYWCDLNPSMELTNTDITMTNVSYVLQQKVPRVRHGPLKLRTKHGGDNSRSLQKNGFQAKCFSRIQRGRKIMRTQQILAQLLISPRSYSLPKFTTYTVVKSQFLGLQLSRQILSVKI
jgi:hypothetical protein